MSTVLHVPDVSEFQPQVDWAKVREWNGGAAIIRAHNGYRVDKAWYNGARRKAAHDAGVNVLGFYLYLAGDLDPVGQADSFAHIVGELVPGEFAIVDVEEGYGDQAERAAAACDHLDRVLTYPGYHGTWLYSGVSFALNHGLVPIFESVRHTSLAAYQFSEPADSRLPHTLWQHTDGHYGNRHPIPGIDTAGPDYTDCSIHRGTLTDLRAKVCTT